MTSVQRIRRIVGVRPHLVPAFADVDGVRGTEHMYSVCSPARYSTSVDLATLSSMVRDAVTARYPGYEVLEKYSAHSTPHASTEDSAVLYSVLHKHKGSLTSV